MSSDSSSKGWSIHQPLQSLRALGRGLSHQMMRPMRACRCLKRQLPMWHSARQCRLLWPSACKQTRASPRRFQVPLTTLVRDKRRGSGTTDGVKGIENRRVWSMDDGGISPATSSSLKQLIQDEEAKAVSKPTLQSRSHQFSRNNPIMTFHKTIQQ